MQAKPNFPVTGISVFLLGGLFINIIKIINNNIVSAYDTNGEEVVVMGRGIGFKKLIDSEIDSDKVEKVFRMDNQEQIEQLKALFSSLELEKIEITNTIIDYAISKLGTKLNPSIYITLVDHIEFAIYRHNNNISFYNALLNEIKIFYPEEFEIGVYALRLIKKKTGIDFPEDEAAAIAIHIYNAEYDTSIGDSIKAVEIADNLIRKIFEFVGTSFDINIYSNQKIAAFLRTLCFAVIRKVTPEPKIPQLYNSIMLLYPKETIFADAIAKSIKEDFSYQMAKEEIATLAIFIKQL